MNASTRRGLAPGGAPNTPGPPAGQRPGVSRRTALVGLTWLLTAAGAVMLATIGAATQTPVTELDNLWVIAFAALGADVLVFASVGAILAVRRPGNVVGLVLLASGPLIVMTFSGFMLGARLTEANGPTDPLAVVGSVIGSVTIYATLIVVGPVLALMFPDGRLPGRRWRWPVAGIATAGILGTGLALLRPGPLNKGLADSPFGLSGTDWVASVSALGAALAALTVPAALLLAVAAVIVRFRRAGRIEREQLKWFLAANTVVAVLLILVVGNSGQSIRPVGVLGMISLSLPPIAVGIAILRYRLYDIDRIISRSIGYGVITGILFGVFVVVNLTLQAWLSPLLGSGGFVAVAASTLLVAALFNPLRGRVQRAVDRRFDRSRYDAEQTVAALAATLRDEVDLAVLGLAITDVVERSVAPSMTGLWLRQGPAG